MLCGFSWVLQKVLKLTSILLPTSVMLSWGLEGLCFFLLALAANGGKSWIWNVDFFCSPWSTFSLQPNRMCYMNVFSANFWDGCSSVYLFFFRLTLFVGVEAFDCRKEISDMCNRAAIIFSFKGLLVLLSLYGYLGIQYGYLILYLVAKKDEER